MSEELVEVTASETRTYAQKLVQEIYGVQLARQARSFYAPLQLFAVIWGIEQMEGEEIFRDWTKENPLRIRRRSHDLARQLLNGDLREKWKEWKESPVEHQTTWDVFGKVFESLVVSFPYERAQKVQATKRHLQPYMGELIHWDYAEKSRSRPEAKLERVWYRTGHMLVYELLRTDQDEERRERIKKGLSDLVADSNDSLGRVATIVGKNDTVRSDDEEGWPDEEFERHDPVKRHSKWQGLMCEGVDRILTDPVSPVAKKIDHLMYWIPFCLAKHMVARAFKSMGQESPAVPVDMGAEGELRRLSRDRLFRDRNSLEEAVFYRASLEEPESPVSVRLKDKDFPAGKSNGRKSIEAMADFYIATMADIGALNQNAKSGFYTLKLNLLETIVYATVDREDSISFDSFCTDVLYEKLELVVDPSSGQKSQSINWVDNEDLERNKKGLADRLEALGLITSFSDATRMVGPTR